MDCRGFEGAVRGVARQLIEWVDLTLVIAADADFLKRYGELPLDPRERRRYWQRKLAPSIVRKRLTRLDDELGFSASEGGVSDLRRDTYEWFSLFAHGHPISHAVSAHTVPLDDPDRLELTSIFGGIGEVARTTLSRTALYVGTFFNELDRLLFNKHGWGEVQTADDARHYRHRSAVIQMMIAGGVDARPVEGSRGGSRSA